MPCGGCTLCCTDDLIVLHPENGDRIEDYDCEEVFNPVMRRTMHALKRDPATNACVYLGPHGCTIHDRAPAICREFDCRALYRSFDRATRRRLIANGSVSKDVLEAGRKRC